MCTVRGVVQGAIGSARFYPPEQFWVIGIIFQYCYPGAYNYNPVFCADYIGALPFVCMYNSSQCNGTGLLSLGFLFTRPIYKVALTGIGYPGLTAIQASPVGQEGRRVVVCVGGDLIGGRLGGGKAGHGREGMPGFRKCGCDAAMTCEAVMLSCVPWTAVSGVHCSRVHHMWVWSKPIITLQHTISVCCVDIHADLDICCCEPAAANSGNCLWR